MVNVFSSPGPSGEVDACDCDFVTASRSLQYNEQRAGIEHGCKTVIAEAYVKAQPACLVLGWMG